MAKKREYKIRVRCNICEHGVELDYKRPEELKRYMNRLGKILPRRATHFCSKHQRQLAREVKRARKMALLPYVGER
ncbi:MAG: 30S ribosomal protein S18 [Candidatus Bipolaricaulia bacterium]